MTEGMKWRREMVAELYQKYGSRQSEKVDKKGGQKRWTYLYSILSPFLETWTNKSISLSGKKARTLSRASFPTLKDEIFPARGEEKGGQHYGRSKKDDG